MGVAKKLFWELPLLVIVPVLKLRFKRKFVRPTKITSNRKQIHLIDLQPRPGSVNQIFFHYPMRLPRYLIGIQERLNVLAREYCLDQIRNFEPGTVIDIGSNIGEFTLIADQLFPNCTFIRFEPSSTECEASKLNLTGVRDVLIEKPLWDKVDLIPFYELNQSGDSSLFQPEPNIKYSLRETTTLDIELAKLSIKSIELLKLEAEGAEPEILQGARKSLKITKRVTADLGPERGISHDRTFEQVNEILVSEGFMLIGRNPGGRECYLYSRV